MFPLKSGNLLSHLKHFGQWRKDMMIGANRTVVPATIETMAWAYTEICAGEDPWTAVATLPMRGMDMQNTCVPIW